MPNFGFNLLTVQYFRTIPEVSEDVNLGLIFGGLLAKVLYPRDLRACAKTKAVLTATPHTGQISDILEEVG